MTIDRGFRLGSNARLLFVKELFFLKEILIRYACAASPYNALKINKKTYRNIPFSNPLLELVALAGVLVEVDRISGDIEFLERAHRRQIVYRDIADQIVRNIVNYNPGQRAQQRHLLKFVFGQMDLLQW